MFVGWFDKQRTKTINKETIVISEATIRRLNEPIRFPYDGTPNSKNKYQDYTLDALWASITAEGYEGVYDGQPHTLKNIELICRSTDMGEKYAAQVSNLLQLSDITYATSQDGEYTTTQPTSPTWASISCT